MKLFRSGFVVFFVVLGWLGSGLAEDISSRGRWRLTSTEKSAVAGFELRSQVARQALAEAEKQAQTARQEIQAIQQEAGETIQEVKARHGLHERTPLDLDRRTWEWFLADPASVDSWTVSRKDK